ncbi:metallophosphoesterase [Curtobacterium sp. TXMA1]|uniref:metallophosphoesterase family protein n=1 Tax=Curtobacterium sp. TXMA1 TaxID=2876939 RepID=UPI001CCA23D8|nr:metallophosphoesterase [Curtobacterium sp. TXMA1]UBQ01884.1 metallophosphoesterase [Curtobacterium sp. TXMA1]
MPTNAPPGTDRQPRRRRLTASQRRIWPTADGAPDFDLTCPGERRVAIAGDWESNLDAVHAILRTLTNTAPDVRTILHLGDLRYEAPVLVGGKQVFLRNTIVRLDALLNEFGIRRLLLTPGNHDWPEQLHAEVTRHPDRPYRISQRIWVLPRGFRFRLGTTTFLSFGGAASLNKGPGDRGWSMHEAPTADDVDRASAAGTTDVLLTHEAPDVHIREVDDILRAASTWPAARLRASATSRALVTELLRNVAPKYAFHGHMHVDGETDRNGTSTYSLAILGKPRNIGIFDVHESHFSWLDQISSMVGKSDAANRSRTARTARTARTDDDSHDDSARHGPTTV